MSGDGVVRIVTFEGGRGGMKTVVGVASRGLGGFSLLAMVYFAGNGDDSYFGIRSTPVLPQ